MRPLLQQNKKAISEIVSYVLLIVIAVSVSTLVFTFLKSYIPKGEKPECPEGISISIKNYTCQNTQLGLSFYNTGRFTIDAVYVRVAEEGRDVKFWINPESTGDNFYINITPQMSVSKEYSTTRIQEAGNYELELLPAVKNEKGYLAACNKAIVTQTITCSG